MPGHEIPLRVGSSSVKLVKDMVEYPLDIDTAGFTRTGEDGALKMLTLFGGDEMVGEVLEGQWHKWWDAQMDAAQAFTAILDGSGTLEFEGEADVAGTMGRGGINNSLITPLLDETELTVAMQVPIDDTGAVADRDIEFWYVLYPDKELASNPWQNNMLYINIIVSENGLLINIIKRIGGSSTTIFTGSTYDDATSWDTGNLEACIFRFVFHGKPGTSGAHVHIYLKQSNTLTNAEDADENELTTSPYDTDGFLFHAAYNSLLIGSENTSYYDAGQEAKVGYVRVTYPDYETHPVTAEANLNLGMVELWDGDPDSGGIRVYDEDHEFTNDVYMQNGLFRVKVTELTIRSLKVFGYYGATYDSFNDAVTVKLITDNKFLRHPVFENIVYLSPEKVILKISLLDTAINDRDYYTTFYVTLKRGLYYAEFEVITIYPFQILQVINETAAAQLRFGYSGNCKIGDDDLDLTGNNTTMDDCFMVGFDDASDAMLASMFPRIKPTAGTGALTVYDGGDLYINSFPPDLDDMIFAVGITPFSLVAKLFQEAEDGSYGAAGTVTDAAASPPAGPNNAVQLNAIGDYTVPNGEYSAYTFTAGTHLPAGRYIAAIRARYVDIETMEMYVYNSSDSVYRNEENAKVTKTLAATFGYHCVVFDITDADVTGTDAFAVVAEKTTDNADEIRTDYMLIIPIGDGESWPQDLAHNALRDIVNARRIYQR